MLTAARWAGLRRAVFHGLAVALFAAQLTAVLHPYDLDSHRDDLRCEICVHFSNLDHACAGPALAVAAVVLHCAPAERASSRYHVPTPRHYSSRAPPLHA
jgi:hypothetical protein